jgi:transcriptional regulator with XRE-family HTH domain
MGIRKGREALSDGIRDWLRQLFRKLGKNQTAIARECGVGAPWLSFMLNGRTLKLDPEIIKRLQRGLMRLASGYVGEGQELLVIEIEQKLQPFIRNKSELCDFSPESLRVAADVLASIIERCPSKQLRQQVVELLKVAVYK